MQPAISIIIPVFNEAATVTAAVEQVCALPLATQIIVVNDGSSDGTAQILDQLHARLSFTLLAHQKNRGKASAIRTGITAVQAPVFIIFDADLEYDARDITHLLAAYQQSDNKKIAVFGSRFLQRPIAGYWQLFTQGNLWLTRCTNILYRTSLTDMETCLKLCPVDIVRRYPLTSEGFEIEPELTALLLCHHYTIKEIPVHYNRRHISHGKKIRVRDGMLALKRLIQERLRR